MITDAKTSVSARLWGNRIFTRSQIQLSYQVHFKLLFKNRGNVIFCHGKSSVHYLKGSNRIVSPTIGNADPMTP
jgi:hypothetical protein